MDLPLIGLGTKWFEKQNDEPEVEIVIFGPTEVDASSLDGKYRQ